MIIEYQNLIDAIRSGNMALLLDFHVNMLNLVLRHGDKTFLHWTAESGAEDCLEYLLENQVDLDPIERHGKTPLMLAYDNNRLTTIRKLIMYGASTQILCPSGLTFAQAAFNDGKKDVIEILLDLGVDLNQRGENQIPSLYVLLRSQNWLPISEQRDQLALKLLEEEKLEYCFDYLNPTDQTNVLHVLQTSHSPALVKKVVSRAAALMPDLVNLEDHESKTPLIYAIMARNLANLEILVHHGANPDHHYDNEYPNNFSPIQHAFLSGQKEIILKLVELGIKLDPELVVWVATYDNLENRSEMVNLACELYQNAIPNRPYECCTLLHYACRKGLKSLVEKILESYDVDSKGRLCQGGLSDLNHLCPVDSNFTSAAVLGHVNPFRLAVQHGHAEIVQLFLDQYGYGLDLKVANPFNPLPRDPEVVKVMMDRNLLPSGSQIWDYPESCWKMITLYRKFNQNKKEMVSLESIGKIPDDRFFVLRSGVCWDLTNLVQYIIQVTKGVNQYDKYSPYPGQKIWTQEDLESIYQYPLERDDLPDDLPDEDEIANEIEDLPDLLPEGEALPDPAILEHHPPADMPFEELLDHLVAGQAHIPPPVPVPAGHLFFSNLFGPQAFRPEIIPPLRRAPRRRNRDRRLLEVIRGEGREEVDPNDVEALLGLEPIETYGQILREYLDISNLYQDVNPKNMRIIYEVGSILWARDEPFYEIVIDQELTDDEREEWYHHRGYLGFEEMPYDMSEGLSTKFERIKQEQLHRLHQVSNQMGDREVRAITKLCYDALTATNHPLFFKEYLMEALRGETCVMTFGSTLVKGYKRYDEYQNTIRSYGQEIRSETENQESDFLRRSDSQIVTQSQAQTQSFPVLLRSSV